jgi:uncharacterized membrane protein YvbJ
VNHHVRRDCPNCGAVLAEDAWFCQRCGNPVPRDEDEEEPEDELEAPTGARGARSPLELWGLRVAAGALVLLAAATVTFAVLVFVFGLFVE